MNASFGSREHFKRTAVCATISGKAGAGHDFLNKYKEDFRSANLDECYL